jgi:hypothetical protein
MQMRTTLVAAVVLLAAIRAGGLGPNRLLRVSASAGCERYTVRVSGVTVDEPKPLVSYNITLTPPSGEPMTITDSFAVMPEKDGSFSQTITDSWKKFEFRLTGKYVLSGSAVLVRNLVPLDSSSVKFSPAKLDCTNHAGRQP